MLLAVDHHGSLYLNRGDNQGQTKKEEKEATNGVEMGHVSRCDPGTILWRTKWCNVMEYARSSARVRVMERDFLETPLGLEKTKEAMQGGEQMASAK